ncbi:MAG TPA: glycosyltransferase family 39 protein [Anaerolineales bacterium]|nr:glycosyltransferase family 39 protein [Anaerolineales bacterium]
MKSIVKPEFIGWCIVALGLILRVRQYLANRSFWGDEASLALNVVSRSFIGLTQPLGYHQAAPVGFLFIEKALILLFGNKDYILRIFPVFAGILAIYLIYRIAMDYFDVNGLFALAMFAFNSWMIFYSSELKQYGSDIMITLLLIYLSLRCLKEDPQIRDFIWLGVAGAATIWLSHVAVFILPGIGLALVIEKYVRHKNIPFIWLLSLGSAWLISFGLDYLAVLRDTASDKYFQSYWLKSFIPLPPWRDLPWFGNVYSKFLLVTLGRTDVLLMYLIPALAVIGSLSLFKRSQSLALVLIFPFMMTIAASAWHKYPLTYRFMLFLVPLILLLMGEGIGRIYLLIAKWQNYVAILLCGIPVSIMLLFSIQTVITDFRFPPTITEIKPIMEYIEENVERSDVIYIYYGSVSPFIYYAPFYNLDTGNVIVGVYRQDQKKALNRFFDDVNELQGNQRVWFVISEITYCDGCVGDGRDFFTNYIDKYGVMLDHILAANSAAYLYDLRP